MSILEAVSWAVYKTTVRPNFRVPLVLNAVCPQDEWDALERAHPGEQTLIRGGIANEAEAELLARGTSGDAKTYLPRRF